MITQQPDASGPRVAFLEGQTAIITVPDLAWTQADPQVYAQLIELMQAVSASLLAVIPETDLRKPAKAKYLPYSFQTISSSDLTSFVAVWFGDELLPVFRKTVWLSYHWFDAPTGIRPIRTYFSELLETAKARREFAGAELFLEAQ